MQEALIKPEESKIQRKVSFRETPMASYIHCPECETEARLKNTQKHQQRPLTPPIFNNSIQRTNVPPIQRAVVRTFSIDKLRPVCPVCNPVGETPYPQNGGNGGFCTTPTLTHNGSCTPLKNGSTSGGSSKSSSPVKNNNKNIDTEEEVRRLNSELSELQQSLLDGAAELAAFKDDHD